MPKQLQWAIGGLALFIVGFIVGIVAFQIYLHVDLKNFKEEIAGPDPKTETETETPTTPNVVFSEKKPVDIPGFKWEWDGDHWDKVPIGNPDAPVEHPVVQIGESSNETPDVTPSQKTVPIHENNPERNKPRYIGEATYDAYEKYVTEAWKNYEHNRMSPFPASPVGIPFRTIEEDEKASELWHKLVNEDSERIIKEINNE